MKVRVALLIVHDRPDDTSDVMKSPTDEVDGWQKFVYVTAGAGQGILLDHRARCPRRFSVHANPVY